MSLIAGTIVTKITADNKQFKSAMKDTKKQLGGINKEAKMTSSSFSNMFKGVAVAGVVAGLAKIGKEMVTIAAKAQQTRITFNALLNSDVSGGALFKSIKELGAATPFTTDKLLDATKTLLAFGTAQKDIVPTLNRLGEVAAATGGDINGLALVFAQIKSTGRLLGQDLNQLIGRGFNPLQVIAEKTGRSMKDLKDDMSKGLITFDQVEGAFISATSAGGKFYGLMEKQSKSLSGQLSTLKSNISDLFENIGSIAVPALTKITEQLADAAKSLGAVTSGKGTVGEKAAVGAGVGAVGVGVAVGGVKLAEVALLKLFDVLPQKAKKAVIAQKIMSDISDKFSDELNKNGNSFKSAMGALNNASVSMGLVDKNSTKMATNTKELGKEFTRMQSAIIILQASFKAVKTSIISASVATLNFAKTSITKLVTSMGFATKGSFRLTGGLTSLTASMTATTAAVGRLAKFLTSGTIIATIFGYITAIGTAISTAFASITTVLAGLATSAAVAGAAILAIVAGFALITNEFKRTGEEFTEFGQEMGFFGTILESVKGLLKGAVEAFKLLGKEIGDLLLKIPFANEALGLFTATLGVLGKAFDATMIQVNDLGNFIVDKFKEVQNRLSNGFADLLTGGQFSEFINEGIEIAADPNSKRRADQLAARKAKEAQVAEQAVNIELDLQIADDLMDIELAFEKTLKNMKDVVGDVLTLDSLELDMSAELDDMFANVEESLNPTKRESLIQTIKDELKDIKKVGVIDAFKKRFNIGQTVAPDRFVGAASRGSVAASSIITQSGVTDNQANIQKNTKITAELLNELVRNGLTLKDVGLAQ